MQKVQRWSQPFWICTNARDAPGKAFNHMRRDFTHRHDVIDPDPLITVQSEGIALALELFLVAEHMIDFRHGSAKAVRINLRRAAGDDDPAVRIDPAVPDGSPDAPDVALQQSQHRY